MKFVSRAFVSYIKKEEDKKNTPAPRHRHLSDLRKEEMKMKIHFHLLRYKLPKNEAVVLRGSAIAQGSVRKRTWGRHQWGKTGVYLSGLSEKLPRERAARDF